MPLGQFIGGGRITRIFLQAFKNKSVKFDSIRVFDPDEDILNYSVMKKYSKEPTPREVGDKGWLDQPQPIRTDMESAGKGQGQMLDTVEFIDVEIEP